MKVRDLRFALRDVSDDMEVGGSGHFGELLESIDARVQVVSEGVFGDGKTFEAFIIDIEDRGEEPD